MDMNNTDIFSPDVLRFCYPFYNVVVELFVCVIIKNESIRQTFRWKHNYSAFSVGSRSNQCIDYISRSQNCIYFKIIVYLQSISINILIWFLSLMIMVMYVRRYMCWLSYNIICSVEQNYFTMHFLAATFIMYTPSYYHRNFFWWIVYSKLLIIRNNVPFHTDDV